MKEIRWNKEKNEKLNFERGVSFVEVSNLIQQKKILDKIPHYNQRLHPRQWMYLIRIKKYVYVVPFIEEREYIFLKTIYPSRKYTKIYILNKIYEVKK